VRLTKQQWVEAKKEWEASPLEGYAWLATKYGVDKSNLKKRMDKEQWLKNTTDLPPITTKITNKTTDLQPSKRGRPTKYKPEYCQMIIDYFSNNDAYEVIEHELDETRRKAFLKRPITMVGFAQKIGVDDETLRNWAVGRDENGTLVNPDFFASYKLAMTMQQKMLIEGGLAGVYNSNIAQLMLKNHHGYRDVQVNETEVYISKDTEESLNKLYELRMGQIKTLQAPIEGRFERIIKGNNES
jgi:hypothetical protein